MFRYEGILRLDGNVNNEVVKTKMSAAEVQILRKLHGEDAIRDMVETGQDDVTSAEERADLMKRYTAASQLENRSKFNEAHFVMMFGPAHMPLPERLPGFENKPEPAAAEEKTIPENGDAKAQKREVFLKRMADARAKKQAAKSKSAGRRTRGTSLAELAS